SEIYGDPAVTPQPETYWGNVNPIGERSCYDEGKRAGETFANDMRRTRGADVRIARIFNTYGPWMDPDDGRVVSNFICQALRHEPLTIYGQGEQTRSFCFVDDLVDGLFRLLWHGEPVPFPVNLGNPDERTIASLVAALSELFDRDLPVVYKPLPADDPVRRRPDIARARTLLAWEPAVPLHQGLARTIEWFRERISASPS
ncbi:MAG: NAD-dependent epimerase/dehydratase family protein, partial [Candidatus Dadabacteria bacterium]